MKWLYGRSEACCRLHKGVQEYLRRGTHFGRVDKSELEGRSLRYDNEELGPREFRKWNPDYE